MRLRPHFRFTISGFGWGVFEKIKQLAFGGAIPSIFAHELFQRAVLHCEHNKEIRAKHKNEYLD